MTGYIDNARIPLDGRTARVLCDMDRRDAITEGSDKFGAFIRYAVQADDCCSEDMNRTPTPKRAFLTIESMGLVDRYGKRLTQHFGLVVEPGPMVKEGAHSVIAQWNAGPQGGRPWRSPPCEFGIVLARKLDAAGNLFKDTAGNLVWEERLEVKVHALDAAGQQIVSGRIRSNAPLVRGAYNDIALAFYDGRGGEGRAEFWMDGRQQGKTWIGSSSYEGYGSVYPACGTYNHAGQSMPQAVRLYGWREAPIL